MAQLGAWLLLLIIPLGKKLLVGLGIGVLTYAGLSAIGTQIQSAIVSSWGGMGTVTLAILSLGGVTQSVGIILSAISARIAFVSIGKFGKITS